MTPLACGSSRLDPGHVQNRPAGAYVSSRFYGGQETNASDDGNGVSLGTAMAISGAAVSPNMGYHSSAPTALLMTLFNARLGCWLPNPVWPDPSYLSHSGPSWALRPLLNEMFGQTTDRQRDIYLSDGGHFDNLGLYEMVNRRCRLIFISDAGEDPKDKFNDLGKTVGKIRIDFGIEITMTTPLPVKGRGVCYALGDIKYPGGSHGLLVYMRPVLLGELPADVYNYSRTDPDFPHNSTADQWFGEAQFESYRRLGRYLACELQERRSGDTGLDGFFKELATLP